MPNLSTNQIEMLLAQAKQAREKAYVPYSGFAVGASLLDAQGTVWKGCNIENASYGATNCAERTALFKAVSEGVLDFTAIAIVGGPKDGATILCAPCGICRQALSEFCDADEFTVILENEAGEPVIYTLGELLPLGFSL